MGGGECSEHHTCNTSCSRHGDQEWCSLSLEEPEPEAFGSDVRDACFPKRFQAPNKIVKYDDKNNPSIWLEDYCLACKASEVDNDFFIIQFLPIYLADTSRAWLDHLSRNSIDY
jgi:hypothetical protein